jgi:hypothetical protein
MRDVPETVEASAKTPFLGVWIERIGQGHDSGNEMHIEPEATGDIPRVIAAAEHYAQQTGGVGFDLMVNGRKARLFAACLGGTTRFSLLPMHEEMDPQRMQEVADAIQKPIEPPAPRAPQQMPLFIRDVHSRAVATSGHQ